MPGRHQDQRGNRRGGGDRDRQAPPPVEAIPSPYYFVPVSDQVWHPEDRVSHDIPFSDGISGRLDIEIEAMRPLYIRGTSERPEIPDEFDPERPGKLREAIQAWTAPYTLNGTPAIPGSSLRGVVRSVLKIVSSGSMQNADNTALSVRNLDLEDYRDKMTEIIGKREYAAMTEAGWLRETSSGQWQIVPCAHSRVDHDLLRAALGAHDLGGRQPRPLKQKYKQLRGGPLAEIAFRSDGRPLLHDHSRGNSLEYDKVHELGSGEQTGNVVFTGHPGGRKHMEFIFHSPSMREIVEESLRFDVPDAVRDDFLATHQPGKEAVESWKFWRPKLKDGGWIPVFYLADEGGIWALGLAQMFRLAGTTRVHDGIPEAHFGEGADFTDLLFGRADKSNSLASRVSVDHALAEPDARPVDKTIWTVLGSPRQSFYPNYLYQDQKTGNPDQLNQHYDTWLSREGRAPREIRLKGWKRYAIRPDVSADDLEALKAPLPPKKGKEGSRAKDRKEERNYKAATAFRPLSAGTRFAGSLRFHNLRPHELGALVWALTWGGDPELRHSIGMAKPLGLGSVCIKVSGTPKFTDMSGAVHSAQDCMMSFEAALDVAVPGWKKSAASAELMALADPRRAAKVPARLFGYLKLPQFRQATGGKGNARLILPDYRVRIGERGENLPQSRVPSRRSVLEPATGEAVSVAPAMEAVPEPAGPEPLRNGQDYEGEIVAVGKRLKFLPDGFAEAEAGNIQHPPEQLAPGQKGRAKVHNASPSGNIFKEFKSLP